MGQQWSIRNADSHGDGGFGKLESLSVEDRYFYLADSDSGQRLLSHANGQRRHGTL